MKKVTCIVLGMLLVAAGCGKKIEETLSQKLTEKIIEKGTGGKAKVDLSKGTLKIEDEKGKTSAAIGTAAKIPDGFPSDVFLFKPADVFVAMNNEEGFMVGLKTDKDIGVITEAYKKTMVGNGWKQKASMDMGGQMMLSYEKGKRAANIVISQKDKETSIVINAAAEKAEAEKSKAN
jgi:hypothetical protein